ncbi:hypothetical protein VNO77_37434 [Canavalia gladiata]|uniref:Uncharacterized protein n=1 Tax=Canavalia gladiata TaxID=3824 RepID=A0AAN9KA23_CANGL
MISRRHSSISLRTVIEYQVILPVDVLKGHALSALGKTEYQSTNLEERLMLIPLGINTLHETNELFMKHQDRTCEDPKSSVESYQSPIKIPERPNLRLLNRSEFVRACHTRAKGNEPASSTQGNGPRQSLEGLHHCLQITLRPHATDPLDMMSMNTLRGHVKTYDGHTSSSVCSVFVLNTTFNCIPCYD